MRRMVTTKELEKLDNIKPWYFIQGNFTDISGDVNYNIIPQVAVLTPSGKYIVTAIKWESAAFYDVLYGYDIDFEEQKIYDPNNTEIEPDVAEIFLIDALTGEIVKDIQI